MALQANRVCLDTDSEWRNPCAIWFNRLDTNSNDLRVLRVNVIFISLILMNTLSLKYGSHLDRQN